MLVRAPMQDAYLHKTAQTNAHFLHLICGVRWKAEKETNIYPVQKRKRRGLPHCGTERPQQRLMSAPGAA